MKAKRSAKKPRDPTPEKRAGKRVPRAGGRPGRGLERSLLDTLMDNLPDGIYFKDLASRFLRINKAQADRFHLADSTAATGKTDFDYFSEVHAQQAFDDEHRIIQTGEPIIGIEEKETWPDGSDTWVSTTKMPLRDSHSRIIGTFGVSRDITAHKRMAIELEEANTRLAEWVKELELRNREVSLLNGMGRLLQACRTAEEAHEVVGGKLAALFPGYSGFVGLLNSSGNRIEAKSSWGDGTVPRTDPFAPHDCWALRMGRPHLVDGSSSQPICPHVQPGDGAGAASLCLPLVAQGETLGMLHLRRSPEEGPRPVPDSLKQLALTAADHIALALANLNLREALRAQSIQDVLTGLFNRRYLEESLLREISRARRKGSTLGVIMLDLDHFKRFNDTFGHDAGDTLLHDLGRWLQSNVRMEDIACRYGGEEFVLILPETTREVTRVRAQCICDGVRRLAVRHRDEPLGPVTVSLGVAVFPEDGHSRDALLRAADTALYRAKNDGRDRVVVFSAASFAPGA